MSNQVPKAQQHGAIVEDFIQQRLREDPKGTKEILEKYPVLSRTRWQTVHQREITKGLNPHGEDYEDDE